jgi:lipopolysaccharide/colanic/teichoic acid biosynthesis glycosyltransferase
MSLVGPRPPLPREVALYHDDEFIRFGMKPGITGPWQVSGRNRVTSFAEVIRIESAYLTRWTIWRDFRVLAKTIPAVMRMDGAQ